MSGYKTKILQALQCSQKKKKGNTHTNEYFLEFLGGPVARIPHMPCSGQGSFLVRELRSLKPRSMGGKKKKKKEVLPWWFSG